MTDIITSATDTPDEDAQVVAEKREPSEYERELRREIRRKADKYAAELATMKAQHEAALADARKAAQSKIVKAELKAHAIKAGILDPDALALLDTSAVKLSDDGEVENAADVIEAFKARKPHFFTAPTTTSTAAPPTPKATAPKLYKDMTPQEQTAWKRANKIFD